MGYTGGRENDFYRPRLGLAVVDSSFRDDKSSAESLRQACDWSRELGFDGKVFDNPALIAVVNEACSGLGHIVALCCRSSTLYQIR
jgi:hypothetical protein